MASKPLVVFMRGVNVGKNKRFKPAELTRDLARFDVVNIGAAGTFVIRAAPSEAAIRAAITKWMPFDVEMMIAPGPDVTALEFPEHREKGDLRPFVSVLAGRPPKSPAMPLAVPGGAWQVKFLAVTGQFALSLWRRAEAGAVYYPNGVFEKHFGVSATTRDWKTIEKIQALLDRPE
ncbi:MAG: hypothetical protein EXR93_05765 [Gemmatimonadetes bacterium]|nr:hypothetical protein [Gemmatimonadota bacterium]